MDETERRLAFEQLLLEIEYARQDAVSAEAPTSESAIDGVIEHLQHAIGAAKRLKEGEATAATMNESAYTYWRSRGADDARKGKHTLFRNTKARGIEYDGGDNPPDELDVEQAGRAYLEGFDGVNEES